MPEKITQELIAEKNKQRAVLRQQYLKEITNPHSQDGHVFDPALQRFMAMTATKIEHFRETPKTIWKGTYLLVLPFLATLYLIKSDRDAKEKSFRTGTVAYRDRMFKFQ